MGWSFGRGRFAAAIPNCGHEPDKRGQDTSCPWIRANFRRVIGRFWRGLDLFGVPTGHFRTKKRQIRESPSKNIVNFRNLPPNLRSVATVSDHFEVFSQTFREIRRTFRFLTIFTLEKPPNHDSSRHISRKMQMLKISPCHGWTAWLQWWRDGWCRVMFGILSGDEPSAGHTWMFGEVFAALAPVVMILGCSPLRVPTPKTPEPQSRGASPNTLFFFTLARAHTGKVAEQEARAAVRDERRRAARRTTLAFGLERARRRVVREGGELVVMICSLAFLPWLSCPGFGGCF